MLIFFFFSFLRLRNSLVQTDMGNTGARLFGMHEAPVPTMDSVAGVVAQVSQTRTCARTGAYADWNTTRLTPLRRETARGLLRDGMERPFRGRWE